MSNGKRCYESPPNQLMKSIKYPLSLSHQQRPSTSKTTKPPNDSKQPATECQQQIPTTTIDIDMHYNAVVPTMSSEAQIRYSTELFIPASFATILLHQHHLCLWTSQSRYVASKLQAPTLIVQGQLVFKRGSKPSCAVRDGTNFHPNPHYLTKELHLPINRDKPPIPSC